MDKESTNSKSENNIESFLPSQLDSNWPFSFDFTRDLFELNRYGNFSSLRDFLINTWVIYKEQTFHKEDSENDSDSDEDLDSKVIDSWPRLKYKGFFIEKNLIFFEKKEEIKDLYPLVNDNIQDLGEDTIKTKVYTLNDISYETLICKGIKAYIDLFFKGGFIDRDEKSIKTFSVTLVWSVILSYLLFTPYSSSIRKVLEKENYPTRYRNEIITGFLIKFMSINSYRSPPKLFNAEVSDTSVGSVTFQEGFKNVFAISNIPINEAEKLIKGFFVTKNLNEIISYYEKL
jgi:hypothetical protein